MFLTRGNKKKSFALFLKKNDTHNVYTSVYSEKNPKRKEMLFSLLLCIWKKPRRSGASFFAPLQGALTVEAALVLPLFLFCMISAMQYCRVMDTAVRLAGGLTDAGKQMAAAAYLYEYPEDAGQSPGIAVSALSSAWAHNHVMNMAGNTPEIKNANMAMSSFLSDGQMIDLVMTYQIRQPFQIIKLPGYFFLQRANVRAWTGRSTGQNGKSGEETNETGGEIVYVTETGSVYHEDSECTYLKLSIKEVDRDILGDLRNNGGGKYYACERCGGDGGSSVYITNEGDRYHSSLTCSGLKRTVHEVTREEVGHMKACSKCGGT